MQRTNNYGLIKPDITEFYDIAKFNENADIIDAKLKELEDDKVNISDIVDNLESTDDKAPLSAKRGKELNDNFSNYIAENLIPYPYFQTSCTNENINYTDNGDGTITANGTATGSFSGFTCRLYNEGHLGYQLVLPKGTYTLSGCPDGGSGGTYFLQVGRNTGSWQTIATDTGEGATFTIDEEMQVSVTIAVLGGTTVNNLVFKPMLEVGTVAHEYKPYSSTKLTKGDIVDNLVTGRADLPLSAKQGVVLNDSLESLLGHFYSFGSVYGGTKHRIVEDLPTGIYFFVIADNTSTTVRSKPSMGTILFDVEKKLAWINFQKSDDSAITGFTYSSTEGFVITTSISKYIHIDLINMTNFNPSIQLVTTT